jgi:hypothetical protein
MTPFPIPPPPPEEHRLPFGTGNAASAQMARQLEDKARSASLTGFASPALVQLLAEQGAGVAEVRIKDTSGKNHVLRSEPQEGVHYRFRVRDENLADRLTICGYGPPGLLDEVRAAGERAKTSPVGGIGSVIFVARDGREHLLSTCSQVDQDEQLNITLIPLQPPLEDPPESGPGDYFH